MPELFKKPYEISIWNEESVFTTLVMTDPKIYVDNHPSGLEYNSKVDYTAAIDEVQEEINNLEEDQEVRKAELLEKCAWLEQFRNYKVTNIANNRGLKLTFNYIEYLPKTGALPKEFVQDYRLFSSTTEAEEFFESGEWASYYSPPIYHRVERQIFKEKKYATIGSDTMSALWRTRNETFIENENGTASLSFTMYSRYYDEEEDDFIDNPFLSLMVNERKVKLRYDNKWYDFIIKNIRESSDNHSYTYTCEDANISELSKNGFNVVLDQELENNLGTVTELAKEVMRDTDWRVNLEKSTPLRQYLTEPLYKIPITNHQASGVSILDGNEIILEQSYVYTFHSCLNDDAEELQFLYLEDNENDVRLDSEGLPLDKTNYLSSKSNFNLDEPILVYKFHGKKLIKRQKSKYDPVMKKYVKEYSYTENGKTKTAYGYDELQYIIYDTVQNYIINPSGFTSTDGWNSNKLIELATYPELKNNFDINNYSVYLKWQAENGDQLTNACITQHRSQIKTFFKGQKYILWVRYYYQGIDGRLVTGQDLNFKIAKYELEDGRYIIKDILFDFGTMPGTIYKIAECRKDINYSDLLSGRYGLFITSGAARSFFIENIQFFNAIECDAEEEDIVEGRVILSGDKTYVTPNNMLSPRIEKFYHYYEKDSTIKTADDINELYVGREEPRDEEGNLVYQPIYDKNYEKRLSITVSGSNYYNIIQTLCETFGCMVKFYVERDEFGNILYDTTDEDDENKAYYLPRKWLIFTEHEEKENFIGFRYKTNLQSIQRTLESNELVSKLIVQPNSNEFAKNGFCTIARSDINPSKESYIFDFGYYTSHGLIDYEELYKDLYIDDGEGSLNYYAKLNEYNQQIEKADEEIALILSTSKPRIDSLYTTTELQYTKLKDQMLEDTQHLERICGKSFDQILKEVDLWKGQNDVYSLICSIIYFKKLVDPLERQLSELSKIKADYEKRLSELQKERKTLSLEKGYINRDFYGKYAHFIREGAWISEDYIDDDLYYLNGIEQARINSRPKVTYTIKVLELSQAEGFELYNFEVGEKTFIEDVEFFGWADSEKTTPYKEEVVISEKKTNLSDPTQNTISVKNYKTQFDSIFQRVVAITNSIQFK